MSKFFATFLKRALAVIGLVSVGTIAVLSPAQAQTSTVLPGVTVTSTTTSPSIVPPTPVGLTVRGWNESSGIGSGYNIGGDGKGTVQTLSDAFFRVSTDAGLASNSNPNCQVDCNYTLARANLFGEQITGARAVNQGIGTLQAPVQSVAGTRGFFIAAGSVTWNFTPMPTATPPAP